jgi:hypothetical protein
MLASKPVFAAYNSMFLTLNLVVLIGIGKLWRAEFHDGSNDEMIFEFHMTFITPSSEIQDHRNSCQTLRQRPNAPGVGA